MGNSLVAQWLGLYTSTAGGTGSIPGQGTKIPMLHVVAKTKQMKKSSTENGEKTYENMVSWWM